MQAIVPWSALGKVIELHYAKAGNGRLPIGLERMLRIHFIQHGFNLADLACEEALYDSASLRRLIGIDMGRELVPDSTTITRFRKLLDDYKLGGALFIYAEADGNCRFGRFFYSLNFEVKPRRACALWFFDGQLNFAPLPCEVPH